MAWARQRLAAERVAPLETIHGFTIGDRVTMEMRPGLRVAGQLSGWDRRSAADGVLAVVTLDLPFKGERHWRCRLHRLAHLES